MSHIGILFSIYHCLCRMNKITKKKNSKDAKSTAPKSMEKKIEPRKPSSTTTGNLPPTQCKEVLLLDHDHARAFARRKVESNWDRYAELSDEEDNNPQMMAANFDKILLAPKSIGEHFTFSSERAWEQAVDVNAESNMDSLSHDLFKLNLGNLKNGVGRLPFYLRNGLPLNLFDDKEITDMNFRANYYANNENERTQTKNADVMEAMAKELSPIENLQSNEGPSHEVSIGTSTIQTNVKLSEAMKKLAESTASLTLQTSLSTQPQSQTPNIIRDTKGAHGSEDIQDWLDDILNDK